MNTTIILERYLRWAPVSLAIREVGRIIAFNSIAKKFEFANDLHILDVGCGDGRWWSYMEKINPRNVWGIDICAEEISLAQNKINAFVGDVTQDETITRLNRKFDVVVGNCSLEHIPDLHTALANIKKTCLPNGYFILFVPTPYWAMKGKSLDLLNRISPRLSMTFSGAINGFFKHWHLYNDRVWAMILCAAGFEVVESKGLGNSQCEFLFRLFLPMAFLSFLFKKLFSVYFASILSPVIPSRVMVAYCRYIENAFNNVYSEESDKQAYEYVIVCRNKQKG